LPINPGILSYLSIDGTEARNIFGAANTGLTGQGQRQDYTSVTQQS